MQIRLSKRAYKELEKICAYIADDKPTSAKEFEEKFINFFELIAANPQIGKECEKKRIDEKCRVVVFQKNYLIIYEVLPDRILIRTIQNTKQFK